MVRPVRVAVVGAGIAGLGAATYLRRAGHEVVVLEASARVGGRARTLVSRRGDRCDVGTQYYHSSYGRALDLMREVDLERGIRTIAGSTRFFDERVSGGSFRVHHRVPWFRAAGLRGNAQLAWFMLRALVKHPMDPFALEDHPELDETSAWDVASTPALRDFMVRTLYLVGTLSEPDAGAPSLYQLLRLMRIVVLTDYLVLPGGVVSLHEALARRLDVRLETPAMRLVVDRGRVRGVELDGSGATFSADHVMIATEAPRAAQLLPEDWSVEREFLSGTSLPPAMIVSFFLDRPLERKVWSYFSPPSGPRKLVSFLTDASEKCPDMVPSGKAVLQAWICFPASQTLIGQPDGDVIGACSRELEDFFPGIGSRIEEAHVTRHVMSATQHPVSHHARALGFVASADRRPGVSFCGDYLSGGYLEPALWSAERAARALGT
jgi:protoporphyrinogen/coproporphyrinogen III oxidase